MTVELKTARGLAARVVALALAVVAGMALALPTAAFAAEGEGGSSSGGAQASSDAADSGEVTVSAEADAALAKGASFALADFSRAQKGSNRDVDGAYIGYSYYQGGDADYLAAVVTADYVIVHVPESAAALCDISDPAVQDMLKSCLISLDEASVNGRRGRRRRRAMGVHVREHLGAGRHRVLVRSGGGRGPLLHDGRRHRWERHRERDVERGAAPLRRLRACRGSLRGRPSVPPATGIAAVASSSPPSIGALCG